MRGVEAPLVKCGFVVDLMRKWLLIGQKARFTFSKSFRIIFNI
jgi:hypothetical protein